MIAAGNFPNGTEIRGAVEYRAVGRQLTGYAAVFNTAADLGRFREVIKPGAFARSILAPADILGLVDHDPGRLLGRTGSGTLRLVEDAKGLGFTLDLPETTLGRDVLALAERGDLGGMSFGFRVLDEAWPTANRRELRAVDLLEISVVHSHPAYSQTTISARGRGWIAAPDAAARRLLLGRL